MKKHPKWGYDLAAVSKVLCLHCRKRIGKRPYEHVTILARFGQMFFRHRSCK